MLPSSHRLLELRPPQSMFLHLQSMCLLGSQLEVIIAALELLFRGQPARI